jgi:hypothetical protein
MPALNMEITTRGEDNDGVDDGVNHAIINGVLSCSYALSILSTIMVCWKVYVRKLRGRFAADDWLIIASLVRIPNTGQHTWKTW